MNKLIYTAVLAAICNVDYAQLTANFSGTPTTILPCESVTFTHSTTGGNTPYPYFAWTWTFTGGNPLNGNGTPSTPQVITYNTVGAYPVSLEVFDAIFAYDIETKTNYINVVADPDLVPNRSFECYTGTACTNISGDNITDAISWVKPTTASTDYFNACNTSGSFGVPSNSFGVQTAKTGNAYAGVMASYFSVQYREYIQAQLVSPLVAGATYTVSMYVNLADESNRAVDALGIHLGSTQISRADDGPFQFGGILAQVNNPIGNILNDKTNWVLISGTYIAAGGEQYITIGNFKTIANTSIQTVPGGVSFIGAYYFIDDVSVVCISGCVLPIELISFTGKNEGDKNILEWTTANEINDDNFQIEKSNDEINFKAIGKVTGAGSSTTTHSYSFIDEHPFNGINYYRLKQTDYDGQFTYSQTISVRTEDGQPAINISPIPANTVLNCALFSGEGGTADIQIIDMLGNVVMNENRNAVQGTNNMKLNIGGLARGMYFLRINNREKQEQVKFVKE